MDKFDAIIIGSGQAGTPLARRLAKAGWKTLIIERQYVGGTCVNYGCTPTKAMVASAKNAFQAHRASEYGVKTSGVSIDMPALIKRKNDIVLHSRNGSEKSLVETPNIQLVYGEASFSGPKQVTVTLKEGGTKQYIAEYIFINTGARASVPEIEGIDKTPYLDSTTIMDLQQVPKHLLIIGGSYIALEFGQMFRRFGSEVTILEMAPRFLSREDEDIARAMQQILTDEGITICTGTKIRSVRQNGGGVVISAAIAGKEQELSGSHILLAAGRTPNTDKLQLDKAGIEKDEKGYIKTNDKLETNVPGIYALGDVKGGPAFTHISYNDYIIVCKNILDHQDVSIKGRPVPYCMFTDPELGRVGITEEEARKKNLKIKVARLEMSHVARGIETGETRGLMKAIVDADTGKVLGVAILGAQGGELMSLLQIAMEGGLSYVQLRENIFAHPTFSESINNLFMSLDNQ